MQARKAVCEISRPLAKQLSRYGPHCMFASTSLSMRILIRSACRHYNAQLTLYAHIYEISRQVDRDQQPHAENVCVNFGERRTELQPQCLRCDILQVSGRCRHASLPQIRVFPCWPVHACHLTTRCGRHLHPTPCRGRSGCGCQWSRSWPC